MQEKTRKSMGRIRKGFLLLVGLLLVFQLACITIDMGVRIVPEGPDSGRIEFMVAYRLTEKYVEEAKKANQELAADYMDADQPPPETHFPESFDEFEEKPDLSGIPGDNFQMISETPTEMVATNTARYGPGEELDNFGLTTEIDENGWTHYILEMSLPEYGDEESLTAMEDLQNQGLGPKPPVKPPETEPSEEAGGMMGWMAVFEEIGSEVEGEISLEAWYAERILLNVGMPVYNYTIQMPGYIQSHTIDNQTGGTVAEDGATFILTINEDYLRTYGPGEHTLRLESAAHPCAMECASSPHWVWDEMSEANNCSCICEQGWQPDESGNCVSCDDYCAGLDPRAVGDPAESYPNSCACRCDADLMKWEDGKCVC
ncbi:MAG: hypothetical protein JXA42_14525, partial [Anaerolineales bacterium]|nr:hypothetical protein [Anaerolineales bacterium]